MALAAALLFRLPQSSTRNLTPQPRNQTTQTETQTPKTETRHPKNKDERLGALSLEAHLLSFGPDWACESYFYVTHVPPPHRFQEVQGLDRAAWRGGNNLKGSEDFRTENGSSQGQKLAVTGLLIANRFAITKSLPLSACRRCGAWIGWRGTPAAKITTQCYIRMFFLLLHTAMSRAR